MNTLDYRQFLHDELTARRSRNPSYSARAMARDLALSAGFFSQILSGQRLLSEDRAHVISKRLPWPKKKREAFFLLTRMENARNPALRQSIAREVRALMKVDSPRTHANLKKLKHDDFRIVSDWFHMAIYELTDAKDFCSDPTWIAQRLGITPQQASDAIGRLVKVKLLEIQDSGTLRKTREGCKMSAVPSAAIRQFHEQQLSMAKVAQAEQDVKLRDFSGTTMCVDPKKLPRAKAMIRKFHDQLMKFMETGDRTAVFHFSTQMYRLDKRGVGK